MSWFAICVDMQFSSSYNTTMHNGNRLWQHMFLVIFAVGCVVPKQKTEGLYLRFYTSQEDNSTIRPLADGEVPLIIQVNGMSKAQERLGMYMRKNYRIRGHSIFSAPRFQGKQQLLELSKNVGSKVVIHVEEYSRTKTTARPVETFGMIQAPGFMGPGQMTQQTQFVREDVDLYTYAAWCLVPNERAPRFGFWARDINSIERRQAETNRGVMVQIIVNGTAAFKGNLIEGDIILKINDSIVIDLEQARELLEDLPSEATDLKLLIKRKGEEKELILHLGPE